MSHSLRFAGLLLVSSLAACAESPAPQAVPETPNVGADRATVTGLVLDTNGAAIAGATVAVRSSGERTTSDAAGAFTLDVPANTTLTIAATAPSMAPTLLQQMIVSPGARASVDISMVTGDHFKSLIAMGNNPAGGVVVTALKSLSGTGSVAGATVELTPNLGRVMYPATGVGMADPDPAMVAVAQGHDAYAWAVGVQPHISIMQLALHGAPEIEAPYSMDDIIWPGTFTVDAGALTQVTLFTR